MTDAEEFDAFYTRSRTRLLAQTFALTGDLPASRGAVRDSFITAWHHWRKVRRLADPEAWVRPHAWSHAQRRHSGRIWHRDRSVATGTRATLDALAKLPVLQRKALLLNQLSSTSMAQMARELGVTQDDAERRLQLATSQFSLHRGVASTQLRSLFDEFGRTGSDVRWPRATIIRRAGETRRRGHALLGAALVVVALVGAGQVVHDPAGVHASLRRTTLESPRTPARGQAPASPAPGSISAANLLPGDAVGTALDTPLRTWTETHTATLADGNGLVLPCQQARYAQPDAKSALYRTYAASRSAGRPALSAIQATEFARDNRSARAAYRTALGWFAGCSEPRTQLLEVRRVDHVGDRATQFVLRQWSAPISTLVVGVAQSGLATTTTVTRAGGVAATDLTGNTRLLAASVDGLCRVPGAGSCAGPATGTVVPLLPAGSPTALIGEYDLPPIVGVERPWVGTRPVHAMHNAAASGCDKTSFSSLRAAMTRSFVLPGARLSPAFGLTETVGRTARGQGGSFVDGIRQALANCPDRQLGTKVTPIMTMSKGPASMSGWRVTTQISDRTSVTFMMAVLRHGDAVGQLGFLPDGPAAMRPGAFVTLCRRALDRLTSLH